MKTNNLFLSVIIILLFFLYSCVSQKIYEDLKNKMSKVEEENVKLKSEIQDLTIQNTELTKKIENLSKQIELLIQDTIATHSALRTATNINRLNSELMAKIEKQYKGQVDESQKLLKELQLTQENLIKKEDELKKLEKELLEKAEKLQQSQVELDKKSGRINELEKIIKEKDSIALQLKEKISDALIGFVDNGLTVYEKNGNVYVSLEEQLLFASGKYNVEPRGMDALKKLAKVLEKNPDINILIEGHTDTIPYIPTQQIRDNWDLSVMRATAVLKIILNNSKIDPKRVTAAGRGEYMPIASNKTEEGRRKNRRTEIILTPKLEELYKIIEKK